eukprot:1623617-Amphidinium_carterae.1
MRSTLSGWVPSLAQGAVPTNLHLEFQWERLSESFWTSWTLAKTALVALMRQKNLTIPLSGHAFPKARDDDIIITLAARLRQQE